MFKGIDISAHQQPNLINYDLMAKEIDFAIIRASYTGYGGQGDKVYKDTHFERHYRELTSRGVPVGAYHYGCANTTTKALNEAKFFLNVIKGKTFEYPVYYDTEDTYHQAKLSKADLTSVVIAFLQKMESEDYFVGVYASYSWFYNQLDLNRLEKYHKWVAHWSINTNPLSTATMWQFTSTGRVAGYGFNIDINESYQDFPTIIKGQGLNGFSKDVDPKPPTNKESLLKLLKEAEELLKEAEELLKETEELINGL